eukprot:gene24906-33398_t
MFDDDEEEAKTLSRPCGCGVLTFHTGTEDALLLFLQNQIAEDRIEEKADRTDFILKLVDQFCYTRHWMMHIGDEKASILHTAILDAKNQSFTNNGFVAVELGSYCGYSAAVIAKNLSYENGDMLYCIESNVKCVLYTQRLIDLCGLSNKVTVLNYPAEDVEAWSQAIVLSQHQRRQVPHHIDSATSSSSCGVRLLFIDHSKDRYLPDLQRILDKNGLLAPGCVVIADNVLFMQPLDEYLRFVRDPSGPFIRSRLVEGTVEYSRDSEPQAGVDVRDGMEISILR